MKKLLPAAAGLCFILCGFPDNPFDPDSPNYVSPFLLVDSTTTTVFDGDTLTENDLILGIQGNYEVNLFRWKLDNEKWSKWTEGGVTIHMSSLDSGRHAVYVQTCYNTDGQITDSVFTFNIQLSNLRPLVSLIAPVNGELGVPEKQVFSWAGSDPDGDSLIYEFFIGTLVDQLEMVYRGPDTLFSNDSIFNYGQKYYWKVIADDGNSTKESVIRSLTINNIPEIGLISPANGSSDVPFSVTLTWKGEDRDALDAEKLSYDIFLGRSSDSLKMIKHDVEFLSFDTTDLQQGECYKWSVTVSDGKNEKMSEIRTFTVKKVNSSLKSLVCPGRVLSPNFNPLTEEYSVCVHHTEKEMAIIVETADIDALLKINGESAISGQPFVVSGIGIDSTVIIGVTGSDGKMKSSYELNAIKTDTAPKFISTAEIVKDSVLLGKLFEDTITANDRDGDEVTYGIVEGFKRTGMQIDKTRGVLTWVADTIGSITIKLFASDGLLLDTLTYTIDAMPNAWKPDTLVIPTTENGMVFINAKDYCFMMGSNKGESDEQPVHCVCFSYNLWVGFLEVSQSEYYDMFGYDPSAIKGMDFPVHNVSYKDAIRYCVRKSEIGHLQNCYDTIGDWSCDITKNGYRLPTEAEWEYVCRGGTSTEYFTGDVLKDGYAIYNRDGPLEIGSMENNPYAVESIIGNLGEWCYDRYDADYYKNSPIIDPTGSDNPKCTRRVVRGGSFKTTMVNELRSAYRNGQNPDSSYSHIGIRLFRTSP